MASTFKYFSDIDGSSVELTDVRAMNNAWFARVYAGVKAIKFDGFQKLAGKSEDGRMLPVTRKIEYKANPSLHECDARCMSGKHTGKCECRCGGKNHGAGMFTGLLMP